MLVLLAALLTCLMLTTAAAQDTPDNAPAARAALLSQLGTTTVATAELTPDGAERLEFYDNRALRDSAASCRFIWHSCAIDSIMP